MASMAWEQVTKGFNMDKNELSKLIFETEKQIERNQRKRNAITIAAFTFVFFLLFYFDERPDGFGDYIEILIVSFLTAIFYFGINGAIFGGLYDASESERRSLEQLKKQLESKDTTPERW